jgi:hypothetical protein
LVYARSGEFLDWLNEFWLLEVDFTLLRRALADPNEEIICHFRLSEEKISISETTFHYLN